MKGKQKKIDSLEKRKSVHSKELEKFNDEIEKIRDSIKKNKGKISEITHTVEKKGDSNLTKLNKSIEDLRVDIATNKTRVGSCENEVSRIETRKNQLLKNISELDDKMSGLDKELGDLKDRKEMLEKEEQDVLEKITNFKKKHKLGEESERIEKEVEEVDKQIEEFQIESQKLREKEHELFRKKDVIGIQISTIKEKVDKVEQIRKEHKNQLKELEDKREDFKKTILKLNISLDEDSAFAAQLSNARNKLLIVKEELSKVSARSAGIREKSLGNVAVNNIIKNRSRFKGVHGVISELGEVNSKYAIALEIAAGGRIKSVVVEDELVASECIKYLKQNKLGVATFLPLNKLRESKNVDGFKGKSGVYGFALDLISFEPKFKNAFSYVFGNTLVVEDITTARNIGIGSVRMVTIDGDLIEISGAMQGGFRRRDKALGFREKELSKSLTELNSKSSELQDIINVLEKNRLENETFIQELREKKAELEGDIIKSEKSLHLGSDDLDASKDSKGELEKELKDVGKSLINVQLKISNSNKKLIELKTKKQQLRDKISEVKNPTLLAELNSFEDTRHKIREEIIKVETNLKNNESQVSEMVGREKASTNKIIKQQEKELIDFKEQIRTLQDKIKIQQKELNEKELKGKQLYSKFRALFDERTRLSDEVNKIENKMYSFEDKSRTAEQKINLISLDCAKYKAEFAGLEEEFSQYKGVKLIKKPIDELKKEIREFERMRQNIGSVNMKALEIYEAVEKRYNELMDKKVKLGEEKKEILGMMEKIEIKKTELFMKTFEALTERFQEVFTRISTKGSKVYLELENKKNPFEGGMNIKAKITGSKFLDIRSLSGGEKTLTALAFIFAIQEYDPASFYILDEVDAALDKHNSEKLAGLIRMYSSKAQYVMISHNDSVISEADNLYGVSMNEHGMSKIVSLKV